MPLTAAVLVLLSAALHACWNAGVKAHPDPEAATVGLVAGAAGFSTLAAIAAQNPWPPAGAWPWIVVCGVVEALYFATLTRALARLPLGAAYAVSRGGGQLVTWPISVLWFGERAGFASLASAATVVVGLFLRARPPLSTSGLAWALACALTIGTYPLTYQVALATGAPPFVLFSLSLLLSLPLQFVALGAGRFTRVRTAATLRPVLLLVGAAACAASFLLFLAALGLDGAGRTSALRNVSVVFATLLGAAQGELLDRTAVISAGLITLGAIGIAIA